MLRVLLPQVVSAAKAYWQAHGKIYIAALDFKKNGFIFKIEGETNGNKKLIQMVS